MRNIGGVIVGVLLVLGVGAGLWLTFGGIRQGVIETEQGTIVIEFFSDDAPEHVQNWIHLARSGFYHGTTFHRVVPGFVIQGGDPFSKDGNPDNDGLGGPPWNVNAEFNDRPHVRGIVSMARGQGIHSAGSQFFICLTDLPYLDRQYTVFGRVVEGMESVEAIAAAPADPARPERPRQPVAMERVTTRTVYRVPLLGTFRLGG